jgi:hypothetical protein
VAREVVIIMFYKIGDEVFINLYFVSLTTLCVPFVKKLQRTMQWFVRPPFVIYITYADLEDVSYLVEMVLLF